MIYWITGRAGSGKTTLAKKMQEEIFYKEGSRVVILDEDHVRQYFRTRFTDRDRYKNQERMALFAKILEDQGFTVIISCVSPRRDIRKSLRKLFKISILVYLKGGTLWGNTTYEEPDEEEMKIWDSSES